MMLYTVTTVQFFNNNIVNTSIHHNLIVAGQIRQDHINNMIDLYADDTLDIEQHSESDSLGYIKVYLNSELLLLSKLEQHNK